MRAAFQPQTQVKTIQRPAEDTRQKITLATRKDFDVSYFCGSGKGGQAKNKVASGVLIIHRESGAMGRASDSRSQAENKAAAFQRLMKTPQMKFWLARKKHELEMGETLEQTVASEMQPHNLKVEVLDENGKWVPE